MSNENVFLWFFSKPTHLLIQKTLKSLKLVYQYLVLHNNFQSFDFALSLSHTHTHTHTHKDKDALKLILHLHLSHSFLFAIFPFFIFYFPLSPPLSLSLFTNVLNFFPISLKINCKTYFFTSGIIYFTFPHLKTQSNILGQVTLKKNCTYQTNRNCKSFFYSVKTLLSLREINVFE